jgi:hypothetical protein
VDFVLSPEDIAVEISRIAKSTFGIQHPAPRRAGIRDIAHPVDQLVQAMGALRAAPRQMC